MSTLLPPTDEERALCHRYGEELGHGKLLQQERGLLWLDPADPPSDGLAVWLVRCFVAVGIFFGLGPLFDSGWGPEGWPMGLSGVLIADFPRTVQWWICALGYGAFWAIFPIAAIRIWRYRCRRVALWADPNGLAVTERFGGAPTRVHSIPWQAIDRFEVRHEHHAHWMRVIRSDRSWWAGRSLLLSRGPSTETQERLVRELEEVRRRWLQADREA